MGRNKGLMWRRVFSLSPSFGCWSTAREGSARLVTNRWTKALIVYTLREPDESLDKERIATS